MRAWIYNRIKALDLPVDMEDRVISSGAADNPGVPFIAVAMGTEVPVLGMPAEARVQEIPVDIWVHDEPGSMLHIDDACVVLKNNLPTEDGVVVGNMSVLNLRWEETSSDAYDDHYGTNTRRISFRMTTRR